jgi:hypothetical protein
MKQFFVKSSVMVLCITVLFLSGCVSGTKIPLTQQNYSPSFKSGEYSRYKGKRLVLSNFINQAQNTKTHSYSSPDKKYVYEGDASLDSYYQSCYQKAFRHIGVKLVDYVYREDYARSYHHRYWWGHPGYGPPKGVSEFQLTLLSMTDEEFKFKVVLFKEGAIKFDKDYTVTMAAAPETDNTATLEKRAYQLVDLSFTTIMKDRDFQKAF